MPAIRIDTLLIVGYSLLKMYRNAGYKNRYIANCIQERKKGKTLKYIEYLILAVLPNHK